MSGTCKRYQDTAAAVSGTWTATRVTATPPLSLPAARRAPRAELSGLSN